MYSYNYENNFDIMDPLEKSCKISLTAEIFASPSIQNPPFPCTSTQSLWAAPTLSPIAFPAALQFREQSLKHGVKYGLQDRCRSLEGPSLFPLSKGLIQKKWAHFLQLKATVEILSTVTRTWK